MIFNSYAFAIFFLVALVVHYLPLPWRVRKANLTLLSYAFYASWFPPTIVLLWLGTLFDWSVGRLLERVERQRARKLLVLGSIVLNLGLLGYYKYIDFLVANLNAGLSAVGAGLAFAQPHPDLPVGISFYTFMSLSYVIDVYRRKSPAVRSIGDFALYLSFFPHLVAGPIIRADDLLPQLRTLKRFQVENLAWGLCLLVVGLFQKVVIADALLAPISDQVFDATSPRSLLDCWTGVAAFSGQILCDFAGYSTCAIGAAACLGFHLPENFRAPYSARGFSDFWRRWHISLSSWLRDYLYIPLGGNRGGVVRTYVNLTLTMFIGGLWHGASWTFAVWGLLHGLFLILERLARGMRMGESLPPWLATLSAVVLTNLAVSVAWIFFRATSFHGAFDLLAGMFFPRGGIGTQVLESWDVLVVGLVMAGVYAAQQLFHRRSFEAAAERLGPRGLALVLVVLLFAIATMTGEDRAFIYFQF